jgi:hypothetical protein
VDFRFYSFRLEICKDTYNIQMFVSFSYFHKIEAMFKTWQVDCFFNIIKI